MELRKTEEAAIGLTKLYKSLCSKQVKFQEKSFRGEGNSDTPRLLSWKELVELRCIDENIEAVAYDGDAADMNCAEENTNEDISREEMLEKLISIRDRLESMGGSVSKFRERMSKKDPVTNAPRYGEKTMKRVGAITERYDTLSLGIAKAFGEEANHDDATNNVESESIIHILQQSIKNSSEATEQAQKMEEEMMKKRQETIIKAEQEAEKRRKYEEEQDRLEQQRQREELSRRAEVARIQRLQDERRAIEEERETDRAFLASVEVGIVGLRTQLQKLRENCTKVELDLALGALHTIFSQISSRPEEIQFRRIRRDHPKFLKDIGRHRGGNEVLVAAGFKFADVDGAKCFFSKEPDLETDMDGWSSWFDLIKGTVSVLEEEMMK